MKANTPIEVSESAYNRLTNYFSGIVAHRKHDGKFYIKVMWASYCNMVEKYLNNLT